MKISSWEVMLVYSLTPLLVEIEGEEEMRIEMKRGDDVVD